MNIANPPWLFAQINFSSLPLPNFHRANSNLVFTDSHRYLCCCFIFLLSTPSHLTTLKITYNKPSLLARGTSQVIHGLIRNQSNIGNILQFNSNKITRSGSSFLVRGIKCSDSDKNRNIVVNQTPFNLATRGGGPSPLDLPMILTPCNYFQGKVTSRSSSTQSFDEALREGRVASGATSPTIPENKPLPQCCTEPRRARPIDELYIHTH